MDRYPLPLVKDLFNKLSGATHFSKIDSSQAFLQLPLHVDDQQFLTINTSKGLFVPTRLPFGVSSAPSIFQRVTDGILSSVEREQNRKMQLAGFQDDIVIAKKGLKLKKEKCQFGVRTIQYLGHNVSESGITPCGDKLEAIKLAPAPKDLPQLRSFLGAVEYYSDFIPNKSSFLQPLHLLLRKGEKWRWDAPQENAFGRAKNALSSENVLAHFDEKKPLVLSPDACDYGIGCVLKHVFPDGSERILSCASRTLTPTERNYSVLEKEALATIFGVKKFHLYLFGREFKITSDHKPLENLLSPSKPTPTHAASRIQRWALTLGAYDYSWEYRPGKGNADADFLSRLPSKTISLAEKVQTPADTVLLVKWLNSLPCTSAEIRKATARDVVLSRVLHWIQTGWPEKTSVEFANYAQRSDELSSVDGCILWGNRVVIPEKLRNTVLGELHSGHPGMSKSKAYARSYVWWPSMDLDIERACRNCRQCQSTQNIAPSAPPHPWSWPKTPFERVHIDYAGPFLGKMFLVLVDAYSKWLEVVSCTTASTSVTISKLRSIFATHGLPQTVVTDNGTCFSSAEFKKFCSVNGIKHMTCSPYHPASNGLAERAVQTFKNAMKKTTEPLDQRLSHFLFTYRNTPHSTTGVSPAELLFKRRLRSRMDLLRPDLNVRVQAKQLAMQKEQPTRMFSNGDLVWATNEMANSSGFGSKWSLGKIVKSCGDVMYEVKLEDGRLWRRHVDQLRLQKEEITDKTAIAQGPAQQEPVKQHLRSAPEPAQEEPVKEHLRSAAEPAPQEPVIEQQQSASAPAFEDTVEKDTFNPVLRRSGRSNIGVPPKRLGIDV